MLLDPLDIALCVTDDAPADLQGASAATTPIVQTSIFSFRTYAELVAALGHSHRTHVYTRGQNPTVEVLERKLATLERGEECKCFASGMAAISAVMLGVLQHGDHVLFVNQVYGPTLELAEHLERFGVSHTVCLDTDAQAVERAMRPNTRLVWLESPGTMLCRVLDLAAVADVARSRGALTCIDNSWATPLLQKPIEHGVDIVVHTGTKYLGGHSDIVAGAVVTNAALMEQLYYRAFLLNGGILAPHDAWLLLRSLRTLPARLEQHERAALRVLEFLGAHPAVRRVYHPVVSADAELVRRQLRGHSGVLSFELVRGDFATVSRVIDALRHFRIAVSWGGVESIVISPNRGTNLALLDAQQIPHGLIRISVGLEGADLLMADLAQALEHAA